MNTYTPYTLYPRQPAPQTVPFRVGLDSLFDTRRDLLAGFRRIGLLSHQAALDAAGATAAQRLRAELGSRLAAVFGPEHGYFGLAGAGVRTRSERYPGWRIPVYSLYGEHRKPTPAMLKGLDLVVCDLQDIGVRCYTYLATLRLMLHACAEAKIPVLVLDRPIPLPNTVDGPIAIPSCFSFVAPCPLPLVYGMTPGETACWLKERENLSVDLTVAPLAGWNRESEPLPGAPEFAPPSPAIRSWRIAQAYPATVFCEAFPHFDCARESGLAFRLIGFPRMKAGAVADALAEEALPGVSFHPHRHVGKDGAAFDALRLTVTDADRFKPASASLRILAAIQRLHGPRAVWKHPAARPEWFDRLYGTPAVREALIR